MVAVADQSHFDPVQSSIGALGRWQFWVAFAIFLVKFPVAWHQLGIVFLAPPATFECAEPDNNTDKCSANCTRHEFDHSVFSETIITEWDLVCSRAQLANVAQTTFMLGILIGNMVFGYLSDRFGRKGPLTAAVILQIVSGLGAAFVPNVWLFMIFRFFCAVATGGTMVTSFVLVMELVGKEWRAVFGIIYQIPFNLGHLTLSLFSYCLRNWRHFQMALTIPSVILISYYWLMPESPRWLMAVGKSDEAVKTLERAAKFNKLPTNEIRDHVQKAMKSKSTDYKRGNIFDLVRTPNLRIKTICICFNWLVCGMCFFGVAQYLGQAGGNIFVNVAVSAIVQVPGTLICVYLVKALGRRKTLIIANVGCGLACLIIPFIPQSLGWLTVTLAVVGIFWMSISFPTVYMFSGELFPTVVRNIGVGVSSMCARFGSMAAPFVAGLKLVDEMLPPVIFGVISIIGALLVLRLPETLGAPLPDTIEEGELFGKKIKNENSNGTNVGIINDASDISNQVEMRNS